MSELLSVAHYIVNLQANDGVMITPMKLQKLLYYVKAWGLVDRTPLFKGVFRKWEYGPVNKTVYNAFKEYGGSPIPGHENKSLEKPKGYKKQLIDFIAHCYGQYDALALSAMTHKEDPWLLTPSNEVIEDRLINAYYSKQPFANNFPFDSVNHPFYPLQSDLSSAFTMDMSTKDAEKVTVYPSYQDYLNHLHKASGEFDKWFTRLLK